MKSWVLAFACLLFMLPTAALASRLYRGHREYRMLLAAFGVALVLYAALYQLLPPDLGFLPADWLEESPAVGLANGILALMMIFHSFWAVCYVCWTGPSIGLLVSTLRRQALTTAEALEIYGRKEPVNLVLVRRLPNLMNNGYIARKGCRTYQLLPKGERYAAVGFLLRRTINLVPEQDA